MRAFVTGGTGFIGGHLVRKLRERGDEVVALVRSTTRAKALRDLGCELTQGDILATDALREGMEGCDSVFHAAAIYKVGIPRSERAAMYNTNVGGSASVFDAATAAGIGRIVYVSTIAAFGNTGGEVVDEGHQHPADGYTSYYEETKVEAHRLARERIAQGAPIVIVQPGAVYGPGDHSEVGNVIDQVRTGKLRMMTFPELGLSLVHVEDVADGILAAHDRGEIGEAYVLGGEITTMGDLIRRVAAIEGRRPPSRTLPPTLIKAATPAGPLVGKLMGFPPNLRELISSADGVTFWARHDKAREALGYQPRSLEEGLHQTLAATG